MKKTMTLLRALRLAGFLLVALSVIAPEARAQQPLMGASLSMEDPLAVYANPAILSFQRARLALGARAYHLGLGDAGGVPLRQGAMAVTTPFLLSDRFGAGALVQYFDSPILQRTSIGGAVSARMLRFLSLGVQVAAYTMSYDPAQFVEFDPADPVFAGGYSRTVINASLGAYAQPLPALFLSAGVRNANGPDLSLVGAGANLSPEPFAGVGYAIGPMRALVEWVGTPFGAEMRWGVEAVSVAGSYLRFSSVDGFDAARVEGLLHVGGPISVSYGYELPLGELGGATNGSHTFSVVYEFGRTPDLPDPIVPPALLYTTDLPLLDPVVRPRVYAGATSDYLRYYEQEIVRQFDADVPEEALRRLSREDLGKIESIAAAPPPPEPAPMADTNDQVGLPGSYSSQYDAAMRDAGRVLGRADGPLVRVTVPEDDALRANGVRNRLIERGVAADRVVLVPAPADSSRERPTPESFLPEERAIVLEPAQTVLYFLGIQQDAEAVAWEVRVDNADGEAVKTFVGAGAIPGELVWDWRDEAGAVIAPGIYQYYLTWTDAQGTRYPSNRQKLYVQKYLRRVTVRVTRDGAALRQDADRIELRLQH